MNTNEKSLKLAELMGWSDKDGWELMPYDKCLVGLAQFAAILLKFPEVMTHFMISGNLSGTYRSWFIDNGEDLPIVIDKPTQANILDEILRMNGVEL